MGYATFMVHLQPGGPNVSLLLAAASLADRFEAGVIGIAACQPMQIMSNYGVAASGQAVLSDGGNALQLDAIAHDRNAGLVVAGAYGHSRVREWVLGGVTRSPLLHSGRCSLLSH